MLSLSEKKHQISLEFEQLICTYQDEFPHLSAYQLRFTRTKRVMGSCHYGKQQINISELILEHNPISIQLDTLKHEIAHAIAYSKGEHGHGRLWQYWATKLGASPNARYKQSLAMEYKYSLVCVQQSALKVLGKQYHKKIKLKGRYIASDKSSLNCLYLVCNQELSRYHSGELKLHELSLYQ